MNKKQFFSIILLSASMFAIVPNTYTYANSEITAEYLNGNPEYTYGIEVNGTMLPLDAQKLLDRINEFRREACEKGYFGLTEKDYIPLKWNTQLEELARVRAVEASIFTNHDKPNGVNENKLSYQENLAWNNLKNQDPIHAINLLASEKKYYERNKDKFTQGVVGSGPEYLKIGHYTAIISPYNRYVAVASFHLNENSAINSGYSDDPVYPSDNFTCTAMTFGGSGYGTSNIPLPNPKKGNQNYDIKVFSRLKGLDTKGLKVIWPRKNLKIGEKYKIGAEISFNFYDEDTTTTSYVKVNMTDAPWKSSNPDVLSIDRDGVIKPLKNGTATISLHIPRNDIIDVSKEFNVNQEAELNSSGELTYAKNDPEKTISEKGRPFESVVSEKPPVLNTSYIFGIPYDENNPASKIKAFKQRNEAIENGKNIIDSLSNLNNERKKYYFELIEASQDKKDLDEVIISAINEDDKLEELKLKNSNISLEEKLVLLRNKAKNKLNLLLELSDKDIEKYTKLIEENKDFDGFEKILSMAKDRSMEIIKEKTKKLEKIKKDAIDKLEKMEEIDKTSKANYKNRIKIAATVETINNILDEASEKNEKNLKYKAEITENAKKEAIKKLYELNYLPDDIKENYKNTINAKKEKSTVESALNMAIRYNEELKENSLQINDIKKQYESKLDEFNYLSEDDLNYFKSKINYASSEEILKKLISDISKKNEERKNDKIRQEEASKREKEEKEAKELEEKKSNVMAQIENLSDLKDEDKEQIKEKLDLSKTKEDADKILQNAKLKNEERKNDKIRQEEAAKREKEEKEAKELEEKKSNVMTQIENLSDLKNEDKEQIKEKLTLSKTKEDADKIFENAKLKNEERKNDKIRQEEKIIDNGNKNSNKNNTRINTFNNYIDKTKKLQTNRISGKNRILTSIEVSKKYYNKADTVIIASSNNPIDSLTSSILSGKYSSPILLTDKNKLSNEVLNEIKRLGTKNIIIIGGKNSIDTSIENYLNQYNVKRIYGKDRYETSLMIAKKVYGEDINEAILVNGENFSDALAITPYAVRNKIPILLVRKNSLTNNTAKYLHKNKLKKLILIGGENSLSIDAFKTLSNNIERIYGVNRYETSLNIANTLFKNTKELYVSNGETFDALIIGSIAGRENKPILLTKYEHKDLLNKFIDKHNIVKTTLVGGEKSIPNNIID